MRGLFRKDIYMLLEQKKTVLFLLIFYGIFGAMAWGEGAVSAISGFVGCFSVVFVVSLFSYDQASHWDTYVRTFPIAIRDVVAARYLTALVMTGVVSAAMGLVLGVMQLIEPVGEYEEVFSSWWSGVLASAFLIIVLMPICFRLSVEKARVVFLVLVLIPTVGFFLLSKMAGTPLKQLVSWAGSIPKETIQCCAFVGIPILLVAAGALSYALSCWGYKKKCEE